MSSGEHGTGCAVWWLIAYITRYHNTLFRLPEQADSRGVPCYVEVTLPELVPIYESLGFEAPEAAKELFDVPIRPMRRLPLSQRQA